MEDKLHKMNDKIICEWCEKSFSTKNNLKTHQKTAKYCLKIQEQKGCDLAEVSNSKQCLWCKKFFTKKAKLLEHQNGNCQIKILKESREKFLEELDLQRKIFEEERKKYLVEINSQKIKIHKLKKKYKNLQIKYYKLKFRGDSDKDK